jgi:hypothetical protein
MVRSHYGDLHDLPGDDVRIGELMDGLLVIIGFVVAWLLLQLVILPKLGIDT